MSQTIEVPELKFKRGETVKRNIGGDDGDYRIQGVLTNSRGDKWFYSVKGGRFDGIEIFNKYRGESGFSKVSDEESIIAGKEFEIEEPDMRFTRGDSVERDGYDGSYRIQGVLVAPDRDKWYYTVKGGRFDGVKIFSKNRGESTFSKIE